MKPPLFLFISLFLFVYITIQAAADISPGSALYASNPNQSWTSPNNTFSLRFISSAAYFAAVTYSGGIPVWTAGPADSSASLSFLPDGNLRLLNGSSGNLVWQSGTAGLGVSSAALDDSGNLRLLNGTVSIWSTFDNPTDTIVPSQNLTVNNVLRSGLYSFALLRSGNLTLTWNDSILYWNLGFNSSTITNLTSPSLGLQSIGILSVADSNISSPVIVAYSSDYGEGSDILRFLKLDSDGNLRIYSSARGSGTQTDGWAAVSDQCQVFGYCGDLGICSYNDSSPICGCPSKNFDPIDPKDSKKGCKRKVEIENCPGSATMLEIDHAMFLTYPPELSSEVFFVGMSACRLNCLVSGSCVASTSLSDGTGLCYLKNPNFISGYQSAALPSTSYVKVCGPIVPNPSVSSLSVEHSIGSRLKGWIVAVVIIVTILGLVTLEGVVRAIQVSFWCTQEQPSHRPMMGKVVQMLEGVTEIEKPPVPKAVPEGSVGEASFNGSSSVGALSALRSSAPAQSLSLPRRILTLERTSSSVSY
ncbi:hypothetical protein C3L33_11422, partial [Rhododendron williamsianum]